VKSGPRDEAAWIRHIARLWGPSGADVDLGDDGCVLPPGRYALSTDTLVEGVDFERAWAPPRAIGHKALAANLADLAAMGSRPRFFLLTLGIPTVLPDAFVEDLLHGMHALSVSEGLGLCGGDLTATPGPIVIGITVVGEQALPALRRCGGRPGDPLYLSGPLGAPAEALRLFKGGRALLAFGPAGPPGEPGAALLDRFFRPPSQTELGLFLAGSGFAGACIDVSDGLGRDLARLCEASSCGAEVEASLTPSYFPEGGEAGPDALRRALAGGEEHVLLFSARPGGEGALGRAPDAPRRIGRLTDGKERVLVWPDGTREELPAQGFDHFAP
jgi:thiamine-monophosphate kinase